jgi:hypothetical protein
MALRNQPYIPIYVDDILTDEKLMQCNTEALSIYPWIIFILHKQEEYGKILLKQKHKQSEKQIENFAKVISRLLPFDLQYILIGLDDLIEEKVLRIEGDYLIQKRMVRDNEISVMRSNVGKKGQKVKKENQQNNQDILLKQSDKQNTVIGNVNDNVIGDNNIPTPNTNTGSQKSKPRNRKDKPGVFDFPLPFQSEEFKQAWEKWFNFRIKSGRAYKTDDGVKNSLKKLQEMGEELAIQSIENSVSAEYQGLFVPTINKQNNGQKQKQTIIKNGRVEPSGGGFFQGENNWGIPSSGQH